MGKIMDQVYVNRGNGVSLNLKIEGFDWESAKQFSLIMDFLCVFSEGKNIFVDSYRLEDGSVEQSCVNCKATNLHRTDRTALYIRKLSSDTIHGNIFESISVFFYIFEPTVTWEQFLYTNNIKWKRCMKDGTLLARVSLSMDGSGIEFNFRKDHINSFDELLSALSRMGYKIIDNRFLY